MRAPAPHNTPNDSIAGIACPWQAAWAIARGIAGGAVGAVVGYVLFRWLSKQGLYSHAVPGALLGFGAGLAARHKSQSLAILCALAAVVLTLVAEWTRAPFLKDGSLGYFLTHLHQMDHAAVKFLMVGVGVAFAYWFGYGR